MPNQDNFRSDITKQTELTFFPSRIINEEDPDDADVLLQEIPASFAYSESDVIEVHFYTLSTNTLILSTTISVNDPDVLKSHIVRYADGTFKTYIRVDFSQLFALKNLILIPGEYKVVFNLFSNEIGNYDSRDLYITDISPSKLEVQVGFVSSPTPSVQNKNIDDVNNFVYKYFTKAIAIGVAQKIFMSGVDMNDSSEGVNYTNIIDGIDVTDPSLPAAAGIQSRETTIDRVRRLGIETATSTAINTFIQSLFPIIREQIVNNADEKITESEFIQLVELVVTSRINNLQSLLSPTITIS